MNEWIIQSYSRHFLDEQRTIKGNLFMLTSPSYEWRTWVDEFQTHRTMDPTTLEAASERLVRHVGPNEQASIVSDIMRKCRFRLLNVVTHEEIPFEAFGL